MSAGAARRFYERYQEGGPAPSARPVRAEEAELRRFVAAFDLAEARVLEVGSSRAAFQHLVRGWIGLDLAVSAGRHATRPFVAASADGLPFADASFDAVWSVAVLEHVPGVERALAEIARVLRPRGVAFLAPAWHCRPWASEGLHLRPFGQLGLRQKLVKLTVPLRETLIFRAACAAPVRAARELRYQLRPRTPLALRYRRLRPNYETFWCADADACVALDPHEVLLFFLSRGFSAPWHPSLRARLAVRHGAVVVRKP